MFADQQVVEHTYTLHQTTSADEKIALTEQCHSLPLFVVRDLIGRVVVVFLRHLQQPSLADLFLRPERTTAGRILARTQPVALLELPIVLVQDGLIEEAF